MEDYTQAGSRRSLGASYREKPRPLLPPGVLQGRSEDKAAVITIGEEQVQVPLDYFDKDVLMTRDLVLTKPKRGGQASTSAATARSGKVLVREILVAKYVLRACTLKRTFY